jgi:PAS domain S-box-containing protein
LHDSLEQQDIRSLVLVPFTHGDEVIGFVGFDAVRASRSWSTATIMLLRVLGDTFANALVRHRTEKALREQEAQYRTVVDNVRDIVFQTDRRGRWTFLNPAWEAMTGYSVAEALGQPCGRYLQVGDAAADDPFERLARADLDAAWRCRHEVQLETLSGTTRWVAFFAQAIVDDDGTPLGTVGTLHDITERKRMEEQTRDALRRERELSQLQARVMTMVSHEFQTPLATIRSSAEMLARYADRWPPQKRSKHLDRIGVQVERVSRLLKDIITTGTLEAKHKEPEWTALPVPRFFQDVVDETRASVDPDRAVDVRLCDLPRSIAADEDLLYHILSNLLSNALKYSTEPVTLVGRANNAQLLLSIEDHGIGIPATDQPHLMQPFYRGENVGATSGSGMGMTIVKRAVDAYGGQVSVESTPGVGTRFTVALPMPPNATSSGSASARSARSSSAAPGASPSGSALFESSSFSPSPSDSSPSS